MTVVGPDAIATPPTESTCLFVSSTIACSPCAVGSESMVVQLLAIGS
jgi:hypothetical protein